MFFSIFVLIAIQLNDLNENRKEHSKELYFLKQLQEDINLDIRYFTKQDTILGFFQSTQEEGLELFLKAKSVKDIIRLDSLFIYGWNNLEINRKTYDEMLNTSGIYIIKNKELLNHLNDYYAVIEKYQQFLREINEDSRLGLKQPALDSYSFLIKFHDNPLVDIKKMDTSWIGNYNSPTYLALSRHYNHVIVGVNGNKRRYIKTLLKNSNDLVDEIEQELKRKN